MPNLLKVLKIILESINHLFTLIEIVSSMFMVNGISLLEIELIELQGGALDISILLRA